MDNFNNSLQKRKRIFIGLKVNPSPDLLHFFHEVQVRFAFENIKWTVPENFHITLRFLGSIPEQNINSLNQIIAQSIVKSSGFKLSLQSLGYFGHKKPKVLWFGIRKCEALNTIQTKLNKELITIGIENNDAKFNPHLTLGRIKQINHNTLKNAINIFKETFIEEITINNVCLFESVSEESGPRYYVLQRHIL